MDIEIFGCGERVRAASRLLSSMDFSDCEKINSIKLFPIPTTRDGVRISGTELSLEDAVSSLSKKSFAVGYGFPEAMRKKMRERGISFYDASLDEEFLVENAYITAIGTLCYILGSSKETPSDLKVGIIGYGRIGSAMLRILMFLGAELRVFSSKHLTRLELGEVGVGSSEIRTSGFDFSNISELQLLINTAPCNLSGIFPDKKLPEGLRVIDLASGDSFPGVTGVEYLPSLPDRMYPESSGKAYAMRAYLNIMNTNR